MHIGRFACVAAFAGAMMLAPTVASAGKVGQVVGGLERAQGKTGGSSSGRQQGGPVADTPLHSGPAPAHAGTVSSQAAVDLEHRAPLVGHQRDRRPLISPRPIDSLERRQAALEAGVVAPRVVGSVRLQSVTGAAYAAGAELQVNAGDLTLGARYSSYFDENDGEGETPRLDLWGIAAGGRILEASPIKLVLDGGVAGAHGGSASLLGAQAGLQAERRFVRGLGLQAVARLFYLRDGVWADEAAVAVVVGPFRAGYRLLDFNTGPALHGPELALAFYF